MNFLKFSLVITCFKKTHEKNTILGKLTHHFLKKKTLAYLEFLSDAFQDFPTKVAVFFYVHANSFLIYLPRVVYIYFVWYLSFFTKQPRPLNHVSCFIKLY